MKTIKTGKKSRGIVFVEILLWLAFVTLLALPAVLMVGINVSNGLEQVGIAAYDASIAASQADTALVTLSANDQVTSTDFSGTGDPSAILTGLEGGSDNSSSSGSSGAGGTGP